jgi:hypothetical protein
MVQRSFQLGTTKKIIQVIEMRLSDHCTRVCFFFCHQCNPSLKIKEFHSSTSGHVSAAKGHHHQVSGYAKTVALYKIYQIFIYSYHV